MALEEWPQVIAQIKMCFCRSFDPHHFGVVVLVRMQFIQGSIGRMDLARFGSSSLPFKLFVANVRSLLCRRKAGPYAEMFSVQSRKTAGHIQNVPILGWAGNMWPIPTFISTPATISVMVRVNSEDEHQSEDDFDLSDMDDDFDDSGWREARMAEFKAV